jgi:hypothetical protein
LPGTRTKKSFGRGGGTKGFFYRIWRDYSGGPVIREVARTEAAAENLRQLPTGGEFLSDVTDRTVIMVARFFSR